MLARQRASLLVHGLAAAALVPAFLLLAPASHFDDPLLLLVLALLAAVTSRHDVPLPNGIRFDASFALVLIALALAGPLPAFALSALQEVTAREKTLRAGALANAAAYGWAVIIGAVLLEFAVAAPLTSTEAIPALLVVSQLQLLLVWAIGPAIYGPLWCGHPFRALVRMLIDTMPAASVMAVLGIATAVMAGHGGFLALALFAAIVIVPQTALTYAARTRPVARLDAFTAARRYAHALSVQLGLRPAERRHVDAVVRTAAGRPVTTDPLAYARATLADPSAASCHAGHVGEWWDGTGGPAGLHGELVPLAARIAAVAETWSSLTAEGTRRLSHAEALAELQTAAGTRFDPRVVAAAHAVLRQERAADHEQAMEPRLHHLRVPAPLRRALAAAD
jgi:hypothetical protein